MAALGPVRLLPIPDEVGELQAQFGEYYLVRSITRGTYGLAEEVATLGIPTVLVVRRDLPDRAAYRLTELLLAAKQRLVAAHEEARRLDRRSALATFPVTLHPGAARYDRDAKVLARGWARRLGGGSGTAQARWKVIEVNGAGWHPLYAELVTAVEKVLPS